MKNNWFVITGGPCSGKTTILETLEKKGYKVFYEWARIYIDREIKKGKTIQQIRKNELKFQQKILKLKVDFEKELPKNELVFMERGIPDSVAYYKKCSIEKDKYLEKVLKNCYYKKVFLLELLDYQLDYARTENKEEAKLLQSLLEKSYQSIKTEVIKVPIMSIEKRVECILNNLN